MRILLRVGGTARTTCDFLSKVQVLKPSYGNPDTRSYSAPTDPQNIQVGYRLSDKITQDLSDAFANAPPIVQDHLCLLTGVFITAAGCPVDPKTGWGNVNDCSPYTGAIFGNSWGFRSRHHGIDIGNTYIAISALLWYRGKDFSAEDFSVYENYILQHFAKITGNPAWSNPLNPLTPLNLPSIGSADPDLPWVTVLASLAHELGHVRFAVTTVPQGADSDFNVDALEHCGTDIAPSNFFVGWSYEQKKRNRQLAPHHRWRHFVRTRADRGSDDNEKVIDHRFPPLLDDFENSANDPNQLLYNLYAPDNDQIKQPWASFFGAQTPDEDFVETYKLYALLGNRFDNPAYTGKYLKSLPMTAGGRTANIPQDLLAGRKAALATKITCLRGLHYPP